MDLALLKECLNPEDVALFLDLDYKQMGQNLSVLCPFHGDRRHGSAFLNQDGFSCFSCDEKMDVISLTQKVKDLSFTDAVKALAQVAGLEYSTDSDFEKSNYFKFKLSPDESTVLRFPQMSSGISLKKIFLTDEKLYKKIVFERATLMKKHYSQVFSDYGSRTAVKAVDLYKAYDGDVSPATYFGVANEAKRRIIVCESILDRIKEIKD